MLRSKYNHFILNQLPLDVFKDLCETLNVEGPCNWKHVVRTLQEKEHFFSDNEFIILCRSRVDAFEIVKKIVERQVTVAFLLQYLDTLPCKCASTALINSLDAYFQASFQQQNYGPPYVQQYYSQDRFISAPTPGHMVPQDHMAHERYHTVAGFPTSSHMMQYPNDPAKMSTNSLQDNTTPKPQKVITILEQPKDQRCSPINCEILRFIVESNQTDIKYQWYHNDKPVPGSLKPTLILEKPSVESIGNYYCIAESPSLGHSPHGSARSRTAFVDIVHDVSQHISEFNASDKIALFIGNDTYQNNKQLPAVSRDLRVLTKIFKDNLHFRTLSFQNLDFLEMHRVFRLWIDLSIKGCYCVFYFGGHGYENDGQCYLVPTDAPSKYISAHCIQAHSALEDVQRRCEPSMMLILLDICRKSNPHDMRRYSSRTSFTDNIVFAYATTENREAFEEQGRTYGIFVESLQKHLEKPIRVNHMLSYVQDDVRKSDVQCVEVKTLLSFNRCLTDRLEAGKGYSEVHRKWKEMHDVPELPVLIQCKENGISFSVSFKSILTNCIEVTASTVNTNNLNQCEVYVRIDRLKAQNITLSNSEGFDILPHERLTQSPVQILNLQKLEESEVKIPFLLRFQEKPGDFIHEKTYVYKLDLSVVQAWKSQIGCVQRKS
uniref:Mucosa-associated lymphoid tissue lymphoma translocation protein 1-like n=1 Tax=Phallusia mammillata TaxID=59560 RepID=A0A6F9DKW2_9ASCI|nr:mucosa-associated lymphoid tissue lymphoma translocation protein 1-like [Phallusia mammillata]